MKSLSIPIKSQIFKVTKISILVYKFKILDSNEEGNNPKTKEQNWKSFFRNFRLFCNKEEIMRENWGKEGQVANF